VELPDGRRGFVKRENLMDLNEFLEYGPPDGYDIVQTAGEFMGTPYLWGGTSAKGFDCSGFTQTVFRLNRILLPRDANQQVNVGNEVNPGENYKNVKPGDIIAAGENFGCGSSRENAPIAIKGAGIACVIAKSFARIFYRNAINIGLPILECTAAVKETRNGDRLRIDLSTGTITNITRNTTYQTHPFPEEIQQIIQKGGMINFIREKLNSV
jgi:3-isopropylmalate/(R)-2-methylmalate dehydratase small subunit